MQSEHDFSPQASQARGSEVQCRSHAAQCGSFEHDLREVASILQHVSDIFVHVAAIGKHPSKSHEQQDTGMCGRGHTQDTGHIRRRDAFCCLVLPWPASAGGNLSTRSRGRCRTCLAPQFPSIQSSSCSGTTNTAALRSTLCRRTCCI